MSVLWYEIFWSSCLGVFIVLVLVGGVEGGGLGCVMWLVVF